MNTENKPEELEDGFVFPDDLDKITPKDLPPALCPCPWCTLRRKKEQRRKDRKEELEKQNNFNHAKQ